MSTLFSLHEQNLVAPLSKLSTLQWSSLLTKLGVRDPETILLPSVMHKDWDQFMLGKWNLMAT